MAITNRDFEEPFDASLIPVKAKEIFDAVKAEFLRFRAVDTFTIQFGHGRDNKVLFRILHGDRSPNIDLAQLRETHSEVFQIDSRLSDEFVVICKCDVGLGDMPEDVVAKRECAILEEIVSAICRDQIQANLESSKTFQLALTH